MIVRKVLTLLAAGAAMAAAAAVSVVAAAMALHAVIEPYVGKAGAAAIVAAVAAALLLIAGLLLMPKTHGKPPVEDQSLASRLFEAAKQRPVLATGGLVAAAVLAVRNPRILTMVLTSLMASKPPKPK